MGPVDGRRHSSRLLRAEKDLLSDVGYALPLSSGDVAVRAESLPFQIEVEAAQRERRCQESARIGEIVSAAEARCERSEIAESARSSSQRSGR